MADKVQKIREEVERLQKRAEHNLDTSLTENERQFWLGESNVLTLIGKYIDSMQEEPVSEGLVKCTSKIILEGTNFNKSWFARPELAFTAGAKWQKENLWKPADGDDLPEYDREVVVLVKYNTQHNIHDEEYPTYRVGFGHRPNPDGWDGKNIDTNEVTHYTPKLYDKGDWNAPDIAYWLDVELPKEIEEL